MTEATLTNDKVQAATDALLDLFNSGNLPQAIAPVLLPFARSPRPSDDWSLGNQLIMLVQGQTADARGFRQWEAVGRHVKKGAKALYILAPLTRTVPVTDPDTGETTKKTVVYGFRGVPVFRVEDTEGAPLPADPPPTARPPLPLEQVALSWGYRVEYGPSQHGEWGYTRPGAQLIHLSTDDPITFWHELAHAADARVSNGLKSGQDPAQEIVAETVAAVLAVAHGLTPGQVAYSRSYIAAYAERAHKSVPAAVMGLLSRVQAVMAEILAALPADQAATA